MKTDSFPTLSATLFFSCLGFTLGKRASLVCWDSNSQTSALGLLGQNDQPRLSAGWSWLTEGSLGGGLLYSTLEEVKGFANPRHGQSFPPCTAGWQPLLRGESELWHTSPQHNGAKAVGLARLKVKGGFMAGMQAQICSSRGMWGKHTEARSLVSLGV